MALLSAKAATRDCTARLFTARGRPRLTWWMSPTASSENSVSARPASLRWWADVGGGLGRVHARHGVAQADALVEGGEGAQLDAPAQRGLAHQQAGERSRVHLRAGEQAQLLELVGIEEMGLVDHQHHPLGAVPYPRRPGPRRPGG